MRLLPATLLLLLTACDGSGLMLPGSVPPVTWNKDIQPLVVQRCAGCHTGGGIAPFTLSTYADGRGADLSGAGRGAGGDKRRAVLFGLGFE